MKVQGATCYSFHLNADESLAHLRLTGPLVQAGIEIINGIQNDQVAIDRVLDGDIVIIQRDFPKEYGDYRNILTLARKHEKPVVFDLDDLLFFLPEDHPGRQMQYYRASFLPMYQALKEADLVTVSTPKLGEVLGAYNDNVAVLPNYLDDHLWQLKPPVRKKSGDGVVMIGYMGGFPHKPDLEYIAPVLRELIERYPEKIRMHFWGLEPPEGLREFPQVTYTLSYYYSYREFAAFFQAQTADIFLAPLVDNLFNRCKSPVKFLEYSALGVAGVYSRLEPYGEVVRQGENGMLASTQDEWRESIIQLIENEELRYELASKAQETIREGWLLSRNGSRWRETYQERARVSLQGRRERRVDIVGSIHTQLFEAYRGKEGEIEGLKGRVAEVERRIQELAGQVAERERRIEGLVTQVGERERKIEELVTQVGEREHTIEGLVTQVAERERKIEGLTQEKNRVEVEVAQYAASTSWQITRPLRKVMGKIRRM